MDINATLGMVGTIVGALVGAGIAAWATSRQVEVQRNLEREKRTLEKFEEIHELLDKVTQQASLLGVSVIGKIGHGIPIKVENLGGPSQLERLQMLVDFYAPNLKPEIDALRNEYNKVGRVFGETIATEKQTDEWKTKVAEIAALSPMEMNKHVKSAKQKLSVLVETVAAKTG
jgi:hypothetical protein